MVFLGTEAASQCEMLSNKTYQEHYYVSLLLCKADLPVTPGLCANGSVHSERKWKASILNVFALMVSKVPLLYLPYQVLAEVTLFLF